MPLETGTILNNIYRVVKLLGKGAMGNVYLIERVKDDKRFVVKELIFTKAAGVDENIAKEIFHREAEFMAKFDYQGLPKTYGIFSQDGNDYLVMDYIEGKTLEEIITSSEKPIAEDNAIKWTIELCEIIDYLHNSFEKPIVYRDLKPSNIIITPEDRVKLVDFGIARYYNPDKNTDTFSYGSPGYAAPEQYKGKGQSSPQSDVFGLGVILFQMLTKYDPTLKPFSFPSMRSLNPAVSGEMINIVKRAIEIEPLRRYISVQEFKETLEKSYKTQIKEGKKLPNNWATLANWLALSALFFPVLIIMLLNKLFQIEPVDIPELSSLIFLFCPVLGLIFSIIASRKSEINKNISSARNAILANIIVFILCLCSATTIGSNLRVSKQINLTYQCEENLKNIATALEEYAEDNDGHYPLSLDYLMKSYDSESYMKALPKCPSCKVHYGYEVCVNSDNFTLWCGKPGTHSYAPQNGFWPQYTPGGGINWGK